MKIDNIGDFLDYYARVRQRTRRLLDIIPPDKIEWTYKAGKFTIGDLIRHIATIERCLYAETVAGRPACYVGCSDAIASGYDATILFFDRMHNESVKIFSAVGDESLRHKVTTPSGDSITLWKWLRAMVEHEIHHRGQLYIYLAMLNVHTPPLFGISSEELITTND